MLCLKKMNKNNCGTGNEQSVGCAKMTEWSSTDYQLWNSMTIKKELWLEILLNNKMEKIGIKV